MNVKHRDIDRVIASVTATLAVEGLKPSKAAVAINRNYLEGKISSKEAIERIKAKYLTATVK